MKKEKDFANTANSAVIAISENSKLFYKAKPCSLMLFSASKTWVIKMNSEALIFSTLPSRQQTRFSKL